MRIDLLITELNVGGAERCLAELAMFLHDRQHQVRVISLMRRPKPPHDSLAKVIESHFSTQPSSSQPSTLNPQPFPEYHSIPVEYLGVNSKWQSWQLGWKLRKLVKSNPPDIAQSFLFHANVLSAMVYPTKKIPLIGGTRVADPSRLRSWISRIASMRMEKMICVSQSVALHCEHRERIARDKLETITNGIDIQKIKPSSLPSSFAQRQLGLPPETPCLLFVGRMDRQKGIDGLVTHANELLNHLPGFHLLLVGEGPLRTTLQSLASGYRNERRIHFVGQQENVTEWMRSSRLLLLPTRYEGMPNVILEAMALGLPVATTKAEGVVEMLGQNVEDQAVLIDAWPEWLAMVRKIAGDQELGRRLGNANRLRCEEAFDLKQHLASYEKIYQEILSQRDERRK